MNNRLLESAMLVSLGYACERCSEYSNAEVHYRTALAIREVQMFEWPASFVFL